MFNEARELGVKKYALSNSQSSLYYFALLDQIREFRERHWRFTKKYILQYSNHPVATGGSPIITWLPNQLAAVLNQMIEVSKEIKVDSFSQEEKDFFQYLKDRADYEVKALNQEVEELKKKFPDVTYSEVKK